MLQIAAEVETRRKAFLRKWRPKGRAVADSLEEGGDRLFIFTRLDPAHRNAARTTNVMERLTEEFRRRSKTQTTLPCAETVPMLLWALLASGQISMRKVDGWQTLDKPIAPMPRDLAARSDEDHPARRTSPENIHNFRDTIFVTMPRAVREAGQMLVLEHGAQKSEPVLRFSDMRNQDLGAGRVTANERDAL